MNLSAENAFLPKQKEINIEELEYTWTFGNTERMKGHILIMLANILFGASTQYSNICWHWLPDAITDMRAIFRLHWCLIFWYPFFMPKRKSHRRRFMPTTFRLRSLTEWGSTNGCLSSGWKIQLNTNQYFSSYIQQYLFSILLLAALVLKEPITAKKSLGVFFWVPCERWAATSVQFYAND